MDKINELKDKALAYFTENPLTGAGLAFVVGLIIGGIFG